MPPPVGSGGPRWLLGRLASGVSARLHMRSALLGAVPGRFVRGLVRCPACGRVPVIRGGGVFSSRPQGGVIMLQVCLAGYPEGCAPCIVVPWLRTAAQGIRAGSVWEALLQDSTKASKESSSRVCLPGDVSLSAAGLATSGVVARASDPAWA